MMSPNDPGLRRQYYHIQSYLPLTDEQTNNFQVAQANDTTPYPYRNPFTYPNNNCIHILTISTGIG